VLAEKLLYAIKSKLYSKRRADPHVTFAIDCSKLQWEELKSKLILINRANKKVTGVYSAEFNADLNDYFKNRTWSRRTFNEHQDFAEILEGSFKVQLVKYRNIYEWTTGTKTAITNRMNKIKISFTIVDGNHNHTFQ